MSPECLPRRATILDAAELTVSVVRDSEPVWSSAVRELLRRLGRRDVLANGRFIVFGCPYDFDFRHWERVTDARVIQSRTCHAHLEDLEDGHGTRAGLLINALRIVNNQAEHARQQHTTQGI